MILTSCFMIYQKRPSCLYMVGEKKTSEMWRDRESALAIFLSFCMSSLSSESWPSGPAGAILQRPRLRGSPLRLTEEMWRSENPWCSTEEEETGDAAGMTRAFGVWTCAIPKGQQSTCFSKLQCISPLHPKSSRHPKDADGPVETVNKQTLI